MALLWMDGFDHYGSGAAGRLAMLDGVWAEISSNWTPTATNSRTGTAALRGSSFTGAQVIRRVLGGAKTVVGVGGAFYLNVLPAANLAVKLCDFRDAANAIQVIIFVDSTGTVSAYRGDGVTLLGTSASPAVVASAYQHAECKVVFSQTVGSVEVRINGVTVLSLTGQDTVASALVECSQVSVFGTKNTPTNVLTLDIDDVFAWDDSGTLNNDFLGDRRVRTLFPDADTATEDWVATGATDGFDCIHDAAPDNETTYISAAPLTGSPPTPLTSIYGLQDPPAGAGAIAAVQTYVRMRKTEAGVTDVQVSMLSSGDESAGADHAITEAYTYWMDVHELNPNTGTVWSEASLSAAQLQIKRTA